MTHWLARLLWKSIPRNTLSNWGVSILLVPVFHACMLGMDSFNFRLVASYPSSLYEALWLSVPLPSWIQGSLSLLSLQLPSCFIRSVKLVPENMSLFLWLNKQMQQLPFIITQRHLLSSFYSVNNIWDKRLNKLIESLMYKWVPVYAAPIVSHVLCCWHFILYMSIY